eukprot:1020085-Prymnesium_polylepis.1
MLLRESNAEQLQQQQQEHMAALTGSDNRFEGLEAELRMARAQLACLVPELRHAEHDRRLHQIEAQEALKMAGQCARDIIPVRQELVELKSEYKEVCRKMGHLKALKEEEEASYLIAKKGFARMVRKRHMKALDNAVKRHGEELQQQKAKAEVSKADLEMRHQQELDEVAEEKQQQLEEQLIIEDRRRNE